MSSPCKLCTSKRVIQLLELGNQPICHRFLTDRNHKEETYPLILGQCDECASAQLLDIVPSEKLIPMYDWIKYNEPEKHLDDLVDKITTLPNIHKKSRILGISYKDDSTLERLKNRGYSETYRLDLESDFKINNQCAGIETIQDKIKPEFANEIVKKYGPYDIVIARHILEHTDKTRDFIEAIKTFVKKEGSIIFEVPDANKGFENHNYTTLWEEHSLYFTERTFKNLPVFFDLSIENFNKYEYPYEDSLVAILRKEKSSLELIGLENEKLKVMEFAMSFAKEKEKLKSYFEAYQNNIAFLGAGHHTCSFINFMEIKNYLKFVADDNPNRQGLFMPGSKLPIFGSDMLLKDDIKLCLMALSPESEERAIKKNENFIRNNGLLFSIFKGGKYSLRYG